MGNYFAVDNSTELRGDVQKVADKTKEFIGRLKDQSQEFSEGQDRGEAIANAMLAYRHLEDAKMRLGKVIQAVEGQSVYDTAATPESENLSSPIN